MAEVAIECRVRALYDFTSTDPSALNFYEGDVIEVLGKLDSGWWDGLCHGSRGWFPSNYVTLLSENDDIGANSDQITQNDDFEAGTEVHRGALALLDDGLPMPSPLEVLNAAQGGSTLSDHEEVDIPDYSSVTDGISHGLGTTSSRRMSESTLNDTNDNISSYAASSIQQTDDDDEFHNAAENFLSSMPDHQCSTTSSPCMSPRSDRGHPTHARHRSLSWANLDDNPTWATFRTTVSTLTMALRHSIQEEDRSEYLPQCDLLVDAIQSALFTSGMTDKDSVYFRASYSLKTTHRALLAALARMILSARLAASDFASDNATAKLEEDIQEVAIQAREFSRAAEELQVNIHKIDPSLLSTTTDFVLSEKVAATSPRNSITSNTSSRQSGRRPDKSHPTKELIEQGQVYVQDIQNSLSLLNDSVVVAIQENQSGHEGLDTNSSETSPIANIVARFRAVVEVVNAYKVTVDDVTLLEDSADLVGYRTAMQDLTNGIGHLFNAIQMFSVMQAADGTVAKFQHYRSVIEEASSKLLVILQRVHANSDPKEHPQDEKAAPNAAELSQTKSTLDDNFIESDIHGKASTTHLRSDSVSSIQRSINSAEVSILSRSTTSQSAISTEMPSPTSPSKNEKLKRFFAPNMFISQALSSDGTPAVPENVPWFLESEYNPAKSTDIVLLKDGSVRGGTLEALVEKLTSHNTLDSNFVTTFMLTFRSFCTNVDLLEHLKRRYTMKPPGSLTEEQLEIWIEKKLKLVRLRVSNVLKNWLESYYNEDTDQHILPDIQTFCTDTMRETMPAAAAQILKLVDKRQGHGEIALKKMVLNVNSPPPIPLLPRNLKRLRLLDIDVLELSRQLTILDSRLFNQIRPFECLSKAWSKDDSHLNAKHVKMAIRYCNQLTAWVSDSILSQSDIRKRVVILKHWIHVAERCRTLHNFNSCMAILAAFDSSSIGRLRRTWDLVGSKYMQSYQSLRKLMGANRNFTEYRDIIHSVNPPCIPFLGIYLQDFTFIEDGNKDMLKASSNLINFAKRAKVAEVIREIQRYQNVPYLLVPIPEVQAFIANHLTHSRDETALYNLSLELEPKEREEEKISRLLQESGFM
ncbi:hypothetical protein BZG36_05501 [Bifiguratus adelaidae]|uniref:Ras GEF n=1 Tax=Bifiguratus adelaidae TaxID=1938954 RepID=A0A261XT48_9FUNG|nr:hypothetical protein BZG36_05501 [Bifiguratus adelaidae]